MFKTEPPKTFGYHILFIIIQFLYFAPVQIRKLNEKIVPFFVHHSRGRDSCLL